MTKEIITIVNELNQAAYDAQGDKGLQIQPFTYMTDGNDDYILFFDQSIWDTVDHGVEDEAELRAVVTADLCRYFESLACITALDIPRILQTTQPACPPTKG